MRIHEVLMQLIKKHAPVGEADMADLIAEVKRDYEAIQFSDDFKRRALAKEEGFEWTVKNQLKRFFETPYVRIVLVFIYWWLFRAIGDWKNGSDSENGKEDEF